MDENPRELQAGLKRAARTSGPPAGILSASQAQRSFLNIPTLTRQQA
jgi:hypothetical protein